MGSNDLDRSAEELSALMDGETSELGLRRVLNNIEQDQALCRKWTRFHVASAVLRRQTGGQGAQWLDCDISARVGAALAREPAPVAKAGKSRVVGLLNRPFANVAVAASVSAAVILGWQNFQSGSSALPAAGTPSVAMAPVVAGNSPLMAVSQGGAESSTVLQPEMIRYNPALKDRLNDYLLSHSSNAALNTATGVTPYARVVTVKPVASGSGAAGQ
ncbi:MAG: sigma-E factor negative regulatory protein [Pseudomonadota bacterium]|nr:hypothetical protein [Pseudomonadales bacterium]MDY6921112.1 sigma-E factor negative regulatory protein [Pseudomonadota bacterium]